MVPSRVQRIRPASRSPHVCRKRKGRTHENNCIIKCKEKPVTVWNRPLRVFSLRSKIRLSRAPEGWLLQDRKGAEVPHGVPRGLGSAPAPFGGSLGAILGVLWGSRGRSVGASWRLLAPYAKKARGKILEIGSWLHWTATGISCIETLLIL